MRLAHAIAHPPRPRSHPLHVWPAYGLLVRLTALTGLRAGEVAALRVGRVNPLLGRLEVAESAAEIHGELIYGSTKTYERRAVPIPLTLADELLAHLQTRPGDPNALVFTSPDGGPLRHRNFYGRFYKPAVSRAELDPRTRFHDLRHTAAALMIAEGAPARGEGASRPLDDSSHGRSVRSPVPIARERADEQTRCVVSSRGSRVQRACALNQPAGPPEEIVLTIDEALDLLSHLEDARSSLEEAGTCFRRWSSRSIPKLDAAYFAASRTETVREEGHEHR